MPTSRSGRGGRQQFGTRTEVKNLNSFRGVEKAIGYEIERQISLLESGGKVVQETLLWDADRQVVRTMRSKEEAQDYRYFPDPDLLPLVLEPEWVDRLRAELPELPQARERRFAGQYGLPEYDAGVLTAGRELADYFERTVALATGTEPKKIGNWIMGEVLAVLAERKLEVADFPVDPERLAGLFGLMQQGTISGKIAKQVFEEMLDSGLTAREIVEKHGLVQISDQDSLGPLIRKIVADNPAQAEQFRSGKDKVFGFFVGLVMKETRGKANPQLVNDLLRRELQG